MTLAFRFFVLSVVLAAVLDMIIMQKLRRNTPRFAADPDAWWTMAGPVRLLLGPTAGRFMETRTILFPGTELLFGGAVLLSLYVLGPGAEFARVIVYLLLAVPLVVIPSLAEHAWTPRDITHPGIAAGIATGALFGVDGLISACLGAGLAFVFMFGQVVLLPRHIMGLGGPKAGVLAGAFCGYPGVVSAVLVAYILSGVFAVLLLLTGRANRDSMIPFTPFPILGGFVALLWTPPG